jgi:hypothetical protein
MMHDSRCGHIARLIDGVVDAILCHMPIEKILLLRFSAMSERPPIIPRCGAFSEKVQQTYRWAGPSWNAALRSGGFLHDTMIFVK